MSGKFPHPPWNTSQSYSALPPKWGKSSLETRTDEDVVERKIEELKLDDAARENALFNVRTIHSDYYQIIAYSLLVAQWENSEPASVACLVVPLLSHYFDDNEMLNDGLKKLSVKEKLAEFKSWVKNQQKYPFFELSLRSDESSEGQKLRTLFVAVLPCQLPTVRVD